MITDFHPWLYGVFALGVGVLLGAYFKKRGQKLSMRGDIRRLTDQAQTKTEATEGIEVRIEGAMSSFETAVRLTQAIYTTAVIHCVAERRGSEWCNLYTSVTYGREIDLLSVPEYVDHAEYGTNVLCLRVRVDRANAERLLAAAREGSATYGSWNVKYAIEETITGFRPAGVSTEMNEKSFWEKSLWCREGIGSQKELKGKTLRRSNAWSVGDYLECLTEVRWASIPLAHHPEKLGDLDEIWPTPVTVEVGSEASSSTIRVESIDSTLFDREMITIGTLLRDDLIVRAVHFTGEGPLRFEEEFNGINILTTIDGVPMDAQAHWFLRSMNMTMSSYGREKYRVPADGRRKEIEFPIPQRHPPNVIGTPRESVLRHEAWIVGRLFRFDRQPRDGEHFYDPVGDPNASAQAFFDLGQYGQEQKSPEVVVADPYALDERAMHALAVMAIRENHVPSIHIVTQFDSGTRENVGFSEESTERTEGGASKTTARIETQEKAKVVAQKVATQFKVKMFFYGIESLHDRFLLVGERLWHVGCSFNQLGQEITAIVEMRDERVKSTVIEMFNRARSKPPVFEVHP
jgi:hypothetical protein